MKSSLSATISAAALITALLVFAVNVVGDFMIPAEEAAASAQAAPPAKIAKAAPLIKTADVALGAKVFKRCQGCHTATKDGKNKFGPRLWGVVGRAKASVGDYKYSAALSGLGGEWSAADLDAFLKSPRKFAPGTKMPFAGLKKATERAALIAFLRGPDGRSKSLP